MADVSRIQGPGGAPDPLSSRRDRTASTDPKKFEEFMKVDQVGETDSEAKKKQKRPDESKEEIENLQKDLPQDPAKVKPIDRVSDGPLSVKSKGSPTRLPTPSPSHAPPPSAPIADFKASQIENFAWEEDVSTPVPSSSKPPLSSSPRSPSSSPVIDESNQTPPPPRYSPSQDPRAPERQPLSSNYSYNDNREPYKEPYREKPKNSSRDTSTSTTENQPKEEAESQPAPAEKKQRKRKSAQLPKELVGQEKLDFASLMKEEKAAAKRQKIEGTKGKEQEPLPLTDQEKKEQLASLSPKKTSPTATDHQKIGEEDLTKEKKSLSAADVQEDSQVAPPGKKATQQQLPTTADFSGASPKKLDEQPSLPGKPQEPSALLPPTPIARTKSTDATKHPGLGRAEGAASTAEEMSESLPSPSTFSKGDGAHSQGDGEKKPGQEMAEIEAALTLGAIQPPPAGLIPGVQAPSSSFVATPIHPTFMALLERMVGIITVMQTSGLTYTTITLNAREFTSSIFYGAQIIIKESDTAPKAFNIEFIGSPQALLLLQKGQQDLLATLNKPGSGFSVHRIDAKLTAEKPIFSRKETAQDKGEQEYPDQQGGRHRG